MLKKISLALIVSSLPLHTIISCHPFTMLEIPIWNKVLSKNEIHLNENILNINVELFDYKEFLSKSHVSHFIKSINNIYMSIFSKNEVIDNLEKIECINFNSLEFKFKTNIVNDSSNFTIEELTNEIKVYHQEFIELIETTFKKSRLQAYILSKIIYKTAMEKPNLKTKNPSKYRWVDTNGHVLSIKKAYSEIATRDTMYGNEINVFENPRILKCNNKIEPIYFFDGYKYILRNDIFRITDNEFEKNEIINSFGFDWRILEHPKWEERNKIRYLNSESVVDTLVWNNDKKLWVNEDDNEKYMFLESSVQIEIDNEWAYIDVDSLWADFFKNKLKNIEFEDLRENYYNFTTNELYNSFSRNVFLPKTPTNNTHRIVVDGVDYTAIYFSKI